MNIPEKCPSKSDKRKSYLMFIRFTFSLIILAFFNWVVFFGYGIFSGLLNFVLRGGYLCKVCIYNVGKDFSSIDEYNREFQKEFKRRMKIFFRLSLIDWFFPAIIGVIILFYNYFTNFLNMFLANPDLLLFIIPSMIILLISTQAIIRRTLNYSCSICIYRDHCPTLKKRELVRK